MKSDANRLRPPATAKYVRNDRGEIAYWEPAPKVYVTQVRGYMSHDMAQLIILHADKLYASSGIVHGFSNWLEMTNYDSSCRVDLTAWVMQRRTHSKLHIGVASRLVAMGVSVANLALGGIIHVHTRAESLDAALGTQLGAAR